MLVGVVAMAVLRIGMQGLQRLGDLFQRTHGDAAELALLPGLGTPRRQRATLYRYALQRPLWRDAGALALALLGSILAGAPPATWMLMTAWGALALGLAQVMLRSSMHPTLAPARWIRSTWLRVSWWLAWLLAITGMTVLSARWLGPAAQAGDGIVFGLLWLCALGALVYAIARHERHARRLPHPFLQR
jgi:hypothetical protein